MICSMTFLGLTLPQFWLVVGVLLLIIELATSGFFFIFLGVGGLITAAAAWAGLVPTPNGQMLCFGLTSFGSMLAFRSNVKKMFAPKTGQPTFSEFAGDQATVVVDISDKSEGRVLYRGSEWIATTTSKNPIYSGYKVIIKKTDGIKLVVEALV